MNIVQSHVEAPESYYTLVSDRGEVEGKIKSLRSKIQEYEELEGQCPTCEQKVDHNFIAELVVDLRTKLLMSNEDLREVTEEIDKRKDDEVAYNNYHAEKKEFEDLYSRVDRSLPTEIYNGNDLQEKIATLKKSILHAKSQIQEIATKNEERTKKNTRVQVILEQTAEFEKELEGITDKLSNVEEKAGHIEVLKKAFSTNGLIAYKIENMVKELEDLANDYLAELSDGRFSINFVVTNDKLNVEVTDEGNIIEITALSSGELTRVNTATLIAIRKLMSSISKSRINVLFLDDLNHERDCLLLPLHQVGIDPSIVP